MFDHFAARSVLLVAFAMVAVLTALAGPASDPERINPVIGEKLDSGLGELPAWRPEAGRSNPVAGEKLDSGLGDLPAWQPPAGPVTEPPERSSLAAAQ